MIITRTWAMPNKRTFQIPPIEKLIEKYIPLLEPCLDPFPFEYKIDAIEFLSLCGMYKYGLFDPPYSPRQLKECYNGMGKYDTKASTWSTWKKMFADKIKPGGTVISFGWNSGGLGKTNGFEIIEILLVAHGGMHNDTICVVEQKSSFIQKTIL